MTGSATFHVRSSDGTSIAVWAQGSGPPLVLVHGSLRDHRAFDPLVEQLRPQFSTYAVDRRGFGASGDAPHYEIEQEFRDVAAVVDAVTIREGARVTLFGHSYGAGCAMGAAEITPNVGRLILYEPGLGIRYPTGWIDKHERALDAGRTDEVVRDVLVDILEMSEDDVASRRQTPRWAEYEAAASMVLREARAEDSWEYRPGLFERILAPTIMLVGTETSAALMKAALRAAASMPRAQVRVLDGHGHLAHLVDPAAIAGIIAAFVSA
jgi:pimeloyl-ACP methyl ester carboxylesterase